MFRKIISLVPSQTELLFDLGLDKEIVGLTKFCIYPKDKVKLKTVVGGTKNFRFEVIDQLKPDLIIGNKEENYKEGIEKLRERYKVWISDIYTFEEALDMILELGKLTDTIKTAELLSRNIRERFGQLKKLRKPAKVAYLIWQKPYMVVGKRTFINSMLEKLGFENAFTHLERYPEVTLQDIEDAKPDFVFLSSEPYPFQAKHIDFFKDTLSQSNILLVDGEAFSWYGSRLSHSAKYFEHLFIDISAYEQK